MCAESAKRLAAWLGGHLAPRELPLDRVMLMMNKDGESLPAGGDIHSLPDWKRP